MKKYILLLMLPFLGFSQAIVDKSVYHFCDCLDKAKITDKMNLDQIRFVIEECQMKSIMTNYDDIKTFYKIKYEKDSMNKVIRHIIRKTENCESYKSADVIMQKQIAAEEALEPVVGDTVAVVPATIEETANFSNLKITNYEAYTYFTIIGTNQDTKQVERYVVLDKPSASVADFMKNRINKVGKISKIYWETKSLFNAKKNAFEDVKVVLSVDTPFYNENSKY